MARPRKSDRPESLSGQIVAVAAELFAERGYAATSLAEIARQVGIRPQSIANHFASKDDLYDAVVADFYRRQMAILMQAPLDGALGAGWMAERFAELSVQDRNMLVTLTTEALVAGRGAEVIDRELGPVIDLMVTSMQVDPEVPAREIFALIFLGLVFALDAPRIPAATRALRARVLGSNPRMAEAGQLLLQAVLPPVPSAPSADSDV
jgi:AcrR family transcriptional regulator